MNPSDVTNAVGSAATHGWEAAVLSVICLGAVGLIFFIMRYLLNSQAETIREVMEQSKEREERLSERVSNLEKIIEEKLMTIAAISTEAITESTLVNRELVNTFKRLENVVAESHMTTAELVTILKSRPCAAETIPELITRIEAANRVRVEQANMESEAEEKRNKGK